MNQSTNLAIKSLQENEAIIEKGFNTFFEVGNALTEIRDNKLYKENYSTFEQYCIDRWGIKRNYANKLISAGQVISNLLPDNNVGTIVPKSESQTREISKAPPEEQPRVWQQAQEETGKEQPTANEIKQIVESGSLHVSQGNNDWYTPEKYIESARKVLKGITIDPASSETAQKVVKAEEYYTLETNGLDKDWTGSVWMNPPYSHPEVESFTSKLVNHFKNNHIKDAIVLVNNATDTKWFHEMLDQCMAVCLTKGRISFIDQSGTQQMATRQGQVFLYFGGSPVAFENEFKQYGKVLSV